MRSPTARARDRDRDAAIEVVESAFASGRIIEVDRDKRITEIRRAHSLQDIDSQLGDLQELTSYVDTSVAPITSDSSSYLPTYVPGGPPSTATYPSAPPAFPPTAGGSGVPYGSTTAPGQTVFGSTAATAASTGRKVAGAILGVVLLAVVVPVVVVVIVLVSNHHGYSFQGSSGTPASSQPSTYGPGQAPTDGGVNLLTVAGYEGLVQAVEAKTGSTQVFTVGVEATFAFVDVPASPGSTKYEEYYWDGRNLSGNTSGTATGALFDLTQIDPQIMIDQATTVVSRLRDPTDWYCLTDATTGQPEIFCHADNGEGDDTYRSVTLDGTEVSDSSDNG